MSRWPGKFVIGLTGNIATGKSVVRKMLEHLGAYGIDADALAHRAIAKGAPGYQPVIDIFGKWLLDAQGEIDRSKLGRLVFNDPEAMKQLEGIVHPLVEQAIDLMVRRATQPVVVIEAIKLLEGKLASACDSIWVTVAPPEVQQKRLVEKRGMSAEDAQQRIRAQSPQEQKVAAAQVVIQNSGSFDETWKQVVAGWKKMAPMPEAAPAITKPAAGDELSVQRGRPRDSAMIAEFIQRASQGTRTLTAEDVMAAFGEKAFLLLYLGQRLVGLAGWQVENLVARTTDIYLDTNVALPQALRVLVGEVENASRELQCEVSLIFLPLQLANEESIWKELGYERRSPRALGVRAWQEAALESMPPNTIMLFKQLRQDRVLRPI